MALDLDPIYYTSTMVKILREQGCSQHAMELGELILAEKGPNETVETILAELKEEAKRAFERFKNSGRASERETMAEEASEPSPLPEEEEAPEIEEPAGTEFPEEAHETRLSLVPDAEPPSSRLTRLKELLERIERNRLRP